VAEIHRRLRLGTGDAVASPPFRLPASAGATWIGVDVAALDSRAPRAVRAVAEGALGRHVAVEAELSHGAPRRLVRTPERAREGVDR
jgi:hypothetical protein